MTERVIVVLNTEIPEVKARLLACTFGCQRAGEVDMPQHHCAGMCLEALRIQRMIEGDK